MFGMKFVKTSDILPSSHNFVTWFDNHIQQILYLTLADISDTRTFFLPNINISLKNPILSGPNLSCTAYGVAEK